MNPLLLGALGLGAWLLLSKRRVHITKDNVQQVVADALASGNADHMREIAKQLLQEGFVAQAASLEQAASLASAKSAMRGATKGTPSSKKDRALALSTMLTRAPKYKEDREMVRLFQQDNPPLKVDGFYGPKTAGVVADYDVIPPKPVYWSRKTGTADKSAYRVKILEKAAQDPVRFDAWKEAANV